MKTRPNIIQASQKKKIIIRNDNDVPLAGKHPKKNLIAWVPGALLRVRVNGKIEMGVLLELPDEFTSRTGKVEHWVKVMVNSQIMHFRLENTQLVSD
jgi:hypothetical protein